MSIFFQVAVSVLIYIALGRKRKHHCQGQLQSLKYICCFVLPKPQVGNFGTLITMQCLQRKIENENTVGESTFDTREYMSSSTNKTNLKSKNSALGVYLF